MNKDQLIREYRTKSASFPTVLVVYGMILGTMILTGMSIA